MPFTLIKGRFRPQAGRPDGDSVRFLADNLNLWDRLEGRGVQLGTGAETEDTAQLRFEGIDAIETGAIGRLSTAATENMLELIGFDEANNLEPPGYILSRMTDDQSGRPICFVFAGNTNQSDGAEVFLDGPMLRDSVNYLQAQAGFAYPLYYNTLFADLRAELNRAIASAQQNNLGYWPEDRTLEGVTVQGKGDLTTISPIWPKLWRRLQEYFRNANSLAGFIDFLEQRNERIDILSIMEERGLQDVVEVAGDTVRMTQPPENLRVVGQSGRRDR